MLTEVANRANSPPGAVMMSVAEICRSRPPLLFGV